MDTRDFLATVREHLDVTWLVVTPRNGQRIDVGEEFDVELLIRNKLNSDDVLGFKDIELLIEGTSYARPVGDYQLPIAERLGPGESINHLVRFRALASDVSSEGSSDREPIADVRLRARLDWGAMSDIETKPRAVRAQIYGDGVSE